MLNSRQNLCERLLLVLVRIELVFDANVLMFCRSDCKSVFKVLSLSTGMQFATDLVLMNTQPQRFKADDATRTNHNRGISWCPDNRKGKLLNLVSLTNLFEMFYPRLRLFTHRNCYSPRSTHLSIHLSIGKYSPVHS